jgi:hypothetical protein
MILIIDWVFFFHRLKLKPEEVLNIDQIRNIKSMPLEEVAEYTCREVAIQKSIRPESFPVVNVCDLNFCRF